MLVCLSACEVRGSAGEEEKKNTGPRVTRQPSQEILCGRDYTADNTNNRPNRRRKMPCGLTDSPQPLAELVDRGVCHVPIAANWLSGARSPTTGQASSMTRRRPSHSPRSLRCAAQANCHPNLNGNVWPARPQSPPRGLYPQEGEEDWETG